MSKHSIFLTQEQRQYLEGVLRKGETSAPVIRHAHILLKVDKGPWGPRWTQQRIQEAFGVGETQIKTVCRRLLDFGLQEALAGRQPPPRPHKRVLDGAQEAQVIALVCSPPPEGASRWSLRLVAQRAVELEIVEQVSHETIRQVLKKTL